MLGVKRLLMFAEKLSGFNRREELPQSSRSTLEDFHQARHRVSTFGSGDWPDEARINMHFERTHQHEDGRTAVIVCHGGNIRAIVSEVVGLRADQRWRVASAANCSLTAIERRHDRVTLGTFNETGHLV